MQIEVENFLAGINTVRLFRNERLVNASAYGSAPQANFDDVPPTADSQPDSLPPTPISLINDFIKVGNYEIGAVKITMSEQGLIKENQGIPVIYFCGWDINTAKDNKEISFFNKISDLEFVAQHSFMLNIKAQIGIEFLKRGKVALFFAPSQRVDIARGFSHKPIFEQFKKPEWAQ